MSIQMTLGLSLPAALFAAMLLSSAAAEAPAPAESFPHEDGAAATFRYQAFVAGAPIGEAQIMVSVADGLYRVEGDARSNGWLKRFSQWRNSFTAQGRVAGATRQPAEFAYTEHDRDKHRRVMVRDGTLQVTKNGRERPPRQSPAGPDVVSALFVLPQCRGDQVLHTGRHVYRLNELERHSGGCRYAVVDDDDDTFEVDVELDNRHGLVVPSRITVYAWLTGWVELVDARAH